MLRRDVFIQRYVEVNNPKILDSEVIELEKYVDQALVDATTLLNYVNLNGLASTSGLLLSQPVNASIANNSIHRDPNVLDGGGGRTGPSKQYSIWSNNLINTTGQNASQTPWIDLTIDTTITGELRIPLPIDTNKNAAFILTQKYLGPLVADSSQITQSDIDNLGFWGRKPITGSSGTVATLDPNAVTLIYDSTLELFIMVFKL